MRIAMVSSEANPLIKTGGLGDVVYSLSKELIKDKQEVAIFLPFYESVKRKVAGKAKLVKTFYVSLSWRHELTELYEIVIDNIKYYLINSRRYFDREHLYGDFDDGERFAFFTIAVVEAFREIGFIPDIVHIHDWQPGMLPCYAKERDIDYLRETKYVLTIHNPAFQGLMPPKCLGDFYSLSEDLFYSGKVRFKDNLSTLKSAIVYADKITTVSPNHRHELLTPEGSMGLDSVLRLREWDFVGILNGIDVEEFNPTTDKRIYKCYNADNFTEVKEFNKQEICKEVGIEYHGQAIYSMVSRITWQKGMDILFPNMEKILNMGHNIIVLGSGEYMYEQKLEELRSRYPNNMAIYIGYNDDLAHKIYASSDFFLMPSLFEPCGIGQMIAQRYATLPIVRLTGGLFDTIIPFNWENENIANGLGFYANDIWEFANEIDRSGVVYNNKNLLHNLAHNAIMVDNSWKKSEGEYLKLYKSLKEKI